MTSIATYIDIAPNSLELGLSLTRDYSSASRMESGNAFVHVLQEIGRGNRLVILEGWSDQESFQIHERAESTVQFRDRLKAIHNSPYDQRVHHDFASAPSQRPAGPDSIVAVTHVDVPPPRKEEVEILLRRLAEDSRRETGNLRYDVFQQTSRPNHFTVVAGWENANAFDSHEMQPHTRKFREDVAPMLGALYDERLYKPLT